MRRIGVTLLAILSWASCGFKLFSQDRKGYLGYTDFVAACLFQIHGTFDVPWPQGRPKQTLRWPSWMRPSTSWTTTETER